MHVNYIIDSRIQAATGIKYILAVSIIKYLNKFITDGTRNQVADSLSWYYEYDTIEDEYPNSKFVKADEILDPDGDLTPVQRFVEIRNQVIR